MVLTLQAALASAVHTQADMRQGTLVLQAHVLTTPALLLQAGTSSEPAPCSGSDGPAGQSGGHGLPATHAASIPEHGSTGTGAYGACLKADVPMHSWHSVLVP